MQHTSVCLNMDSTETDPCIRPSGCKAAEVRRNAEPLNGVYYTYNGPQHEPTKEKGGRDERRNYGTVYKLSLVWDLRCSRTSSKKTSKCTPRNNPGFLGFGRGILICVSAIPKRRFGTFLGQNWVEARFGVQNTTFLTVRFPERWSPKLVRPGFP